VNEELRQREIIWNFNPPQGSHFGGIWERVIRSIKRVLCVLTAEQTLTDDALLTLFAEVEFIVNSRPLTPVLLDPTGEEPLTPNHLLILRSSADHSTGIFTKEDNYVRKRWRQVQYLTEQFWSRWKREYLQTLQTRSKWQQPQANFEVGDIVLLYDDSEEDGHWAVLWTLIRTIRGLYAKSWFEPGAIRCCVGRLRNSVALCLMIRNVTMFTCIYAASGRHAA